MDEGLVDVDWLTFIKAVNTTPLRQLVCTNDSCEDGKQTACNPPADGISKEIYLLPCIILCPEADTTEQERPLNRLTGIRMTTCQRIVVIEDRTLEFNVLLQKRYVLDLLYLFNKARAISRYRWNLVHIPDVAGLLNVLVTVDLGLLVGPVRKWSGVRPHSNPRGGVNEFEVA